MKGWRELGLKPTHDFFIILYLLYKKGILNEDDMFILVGDRKPEDSFKLIMDLIENEVYSD